MTDPGPIFSERFALIKGPKISEDCPEKMRIGLWHVMAGAVDSERIESWTPIAQEILRLNREQNFVESSKAAELAKSDLHDLRWDLVFVLCERIYGVFLQAQPEYDNNGYRCGEAVSLSQVRVEFEAHINQSLAEDNSAYRMHHGKIIRQGRAHSQQMMAKAATVLQDPVLRDARQHYQKATRFFTDPASRDFENCIKEATAALEAACSALFSSSGPGLEKAIKAVKDDEGNLIPPTIVKGILAPYHFRGDGKGIAHGDSRGGKATARLAEWTLSVTAASIVLLKDISESVEFDPPPF